MITENNKLRGVFARLNFGIKRRVFEYSGALLPSLSNDIRLHEMKKILYHAANNTEYWRNFAAFDKLPLLTRGLIKQQGLNAFLAKNIPEKRRLSAHTSGSTGEPLVFYQDTKELLKRRFNVLYGLRLHGIKLHRPSLISGLDTHVYLEPLGLKWSDLRDEENRVSILYHMLEKLKPEVLFCTPSYLKMFYMCLKQDEKKFSFKMIYCAGESMYEEDRKVFSSAFQSKVSMWYGTRETGPIAVECTAKKYHLLPWSNYVEIVSSDGAALRAGEEGDIVVTSFYNYVMPFIRYKIGDRGTILSGACRCGSGIPVLKFAGRAPIIIKIPGRNSFAISELESAIASQFADAILQFQLVEESVGEYIFRFMPSVRYMPELNAPILKMLYEIAGQGSKIILEKVQAIPPDASGKTPVFLKSKNSDIIP